MPQEVAVIIGAGSLGVAIARRVAVGRHLILADFSEATMAAVAEVLRGEGYELSTHAIDIADKAAVVALAEAAAERGAVTQVVIAAGVSPVQATTERVLHVDLLGTSYLLEEFGRMIAPRVR